MSFAGLLAVNSRTTSQVATEQRQFALQRDADFGTFNGVRMIVASMTLLAGISAASAQDQERKLVDRILRPDMALVNCAQDKQFAAAGTLVTKSAPGKNFNTPDTAFSKSFATGREFRPRQFATIPFPSGNAAANISARFQLTKADTVHIASATDGNRVASESGRGSLLTTPFAGNRPFPGRGKSQKALSAGGTALTLEQVRELLNKNK